MPMHRAGRTHRPTKARILPVAPAVNRGTHEKHCGQRNRQYDQCDEDSGLSEHNSSLPRARRNQRTERLAAAPPAALSYAGLISGIERDKAL